MLIHVCYVLLLRFNKKSGIECCCWSKQPILRQTRTPDNVETWNFSSPNVQCWSFVDNVACCNILLPFIAAFLEVEKAMFTVATVVPMITTINPGPYTRTKKTKAFHADFNLKVN